MRGTFPTRQAQAEKSAVIELRIQEMKECNAFLDPSKNFTFGEDANISRLCVQLQVDFALGGHCAGKSKSRVVRNPTCMHLI